MSPIPLLFLKSLVPAHTRRLKSGKVVRVRQYSNKVSKHQGDDGTLDMFNVDSGFDSAAWDNARTARINASRDAGNIHLDKLPPCVESMRGKKISYVHGDEKGTVFTVDNHETIYVHWDTGPYAGDMAILLPRDTKDYVVLNPKEPYDPVAFAKMIKQWKRLDNARAK